MRRRDRFGNQHVFLEENLMAKSREQLIDEIDDLKAERNSLSDEVEDLQDRLDSIVSTASGEEEEEEEENPA
jgi:predicted  nucleic acid-binding Zn-ribbon protein